MPSRIETVNGTISVAEDFTQVSDALASYERTGERYCEFALYLSGNNQEERPVMIDLEKYVSHRQIVEEHSRLEQPRPVV